MQGKGMFVSVFSMKAYREVEIYSTFLDCGLRFTPWVLYPLPPGQKCPVLIEWRLCGLQNLSKCFGEEEHILPVLEIKAYFLGFPA
jgi:hypothetical protein